MADYSFQNVLVWDINPGGTLRTLRNGTVTVYNAATDALLFTVQSDQNGLAEFTTTDVPTVYLVSPGGLTSEHITAASALENAAAAALNNDAGVASFVNDSGSATRAALDPLFAGKVGKGELFVIDSDHASLEAALTATATGGTLEVREAWSRSTAWTVDKACTVRFANGGSITQTSTGHGVIIAANDVTLERPNLTGTGSGTAGTAAAIRAVGTVGAYLTGITITDPAISGWSKTGIHLEYASGFTVRGGTVTSPAYAGLLLLSCSDGRVNGVTVNGVAMPFGFANAYGFAATRDSSQTLAAAPHSQNIRFTDCKAVGVPWEGFDTHAGINVSFVSCTATGCKVGFAAVPCPDSGGTDTWAPKNVRFIDCTTDSQVTDGSAGPGFSISGAGVTAGSPVDAATGQITSCTVIGHGDQSNNNSGGVLLVFTSGFKVNVVTAKECSPHGVTLYHSNDRFQISGVTGVDPWSTTQTAPCVVVGRSTYNAGTLDGLVAIRGSKSAANVLAYGFRNFQSDASNEFQLGSTSLSAATTPVFDTGNRVVRRDRASAVGFYGVTPVARAASPGSATGTDAAVINAVVTAGRALGLWS